MRNLYTQASYHFIVHKAINFFQHFVTCVPGVQLNLFSYFSTNASIVKLIIL